MISGKMYWFSQYLISDNGTFYLNSILVLNFQKYFHKNWDKKIPPPQKKNLPLICDPMNPVEIIFNS